MNDDLRTRKSLLLRLKALSNDSDWEQFYKQYKSIILSFCQKQGLDQAASYDVLQETMVLVMRKLPGFEYDPNRGRFRNWLLTLVAGKIRDAKRRLARSRAVSLEEEGNQAIDAIAAQPEVSESLQRLWMQSVVEEAFRRLRNDPRVKPVTLRVFDAYAIKGQPVDEVARVYSLQENAIYQIKNRIMRRLQEEVARIESS